MSFNNECCIKPWDINETLKATFKFLKRNQRDDDGNKISTALYLGVASLKGLNLNTYEERELASNVIVNNILVVQDYSVIISCETEEGRIISTVAYEDIINVQSSILKSKKENYIDYMCHINPLCKLEGNQYYDILVALKNDLILYENIEGINAKFILLYSGFYSMSYTYEAINVVKNLILVSGGIIPVIQLNGYMVEKNPIVNKEENSNE